MTIWRVVDIIKSSADFLEKKGVPDPRFDAEALLGDILNKNRLELYLYFDRPLDNNELAQYRDHIRRRGLREPLQHILGETGFMNLILKTTPAALIPRPETEILVERAMDIMKDKTPRILDIGTGSGCIALSLAQEIPSAKVLAIDVSDDALALARQNATLNHVTLGFQSLDILNGLPKIESRFDLVVSNPPYIAPSEKHNLQTEVVDFDPALALFDGADGLTFYRRFVEILPELLVPQGVFLFEFGGSHQEKPILTLFTDAGYHDLEIIQDHNGDPRVLSGRYSP
jgi:release factor glutamine methyltransferase